MLELCCKRSLLTSHKVCLVSFEIEAKRLKSAAESQVSTLYSFPNGCSSELLNKKSLLSLMSNLELLSWMFEVF